MHLRKRYASLYIPSDFIEAVIEWPATTPLDNPISISTAPTTFHVLHKDVDIPKSAGEAAMLSPSDADSRFSAKVIDVFLKIFLIRLSLLADNNGGQV